MKILITGSAGYLGKNLVSKSLDRNWNVIGLDIKSAEITNNNYIEEICDITDREGVRKVFQRHKPEVVVHCAGALAQFVSSEEKMHEINVGGTEILLEESWEHSDTTVKFIFISSVEVYGIDCVDATEDAPINPVCQYGEDKVECEKMCKNYLTKGLDITIFRPPTITGPGQNEPTLLGQIKNAYKGKRAFMPGGGKTKLQMVNVFDVCEAIFLAIKNPKSKGEIFNVASDDVPTLREMIVALYEYAGRDPKFFSASAGLLRFVVKILSAIHISPIEPQHLEIALKDYTFDSTKLKTTLGWQPTRTDSESACDTYDWYIDSLKMNEKRETIKIKMLRAFQYEDLTIISTGRGIFGQYVYPVYSYLLEDMLVDTGT
ncbi:MAG: NAD(P)-dependent oxidoreductase, partial [Promethearchaeota archaeon]